MTPAEQQRRRRAAEDHRLRLNSFTRAQAASRENESTEENDLEIDLSKKDFFDNLVCDDPKECNAFKAINGSWQFGYRKQRGYKSLEFFWSECCGNCSATYLNGSSESFKSKCCRNLYNNKCPDNTPLIPVVKRLWTTITRIQ